MTQDEITTAIKMLGGLFPTQVTQEHAKLLRQDLKPFGREAVMSAISDHRKSPNLKNGFWDYGHLMEVIRAAERGEQAGSRQFNPDFSFPQVYRQNRSDLAKCGDYEVIIRVHRAWWRVASVEANEKILQAYIQNETKLNEDREAIPIFDVKIGERVGSMGYRRQIASSCVNQLITSGMSQMEAAGWAKYPFLEDVRDCQNFLDQVRKIPSARESQRESQRVEALAI